MGKQKQTKQIGPENLVQAVLTRQPEQVRRLIEAGADLDVSTMMGTPLMVAAAPPASMASGSEEPRLQILRMLIDAGADLNAAGVRGTALEKAIERGKLDSVKVLVEAGASLVISKYQPYESLVEMAKELDQPEVAKFLVGAKSGSRKTKKPGAKEDGDPEVAKLEAICGTKAFPLDGVAGAVSLHVHSSKKLELAKVQRDFLKRGRFVFAVDHDGSRVAMLPTTDKYEAIRTMGTNGANFDLSTDELVKWLRKLEKEEPFVLTGIGFDFLRGEFLKKVKKPGELAKRMYAFCPDIVDQGVESVEALEEALKASRELYFWWD